MIRIEEEIRLLKEDVKGFRRSLHRIPEKGFQEIKTAAFIREKLKSFGIERIESCLETGTVAVVEGMRIPAGQAAPETIAFRADIDGLPVLERGDCPFLSEHEGMMHACGHDGHMAILLAFAKYINERRNELKGRVVFVFQPAEEGPGGAEPMLREGLVERYGIDRFVGLHIYPEFPQGKVACRKGPMMPRNGEVVIRVKGISVHGAQPQKGADAVVAASAVVLALQTIVSRNISPLEPALLTLGKINGGEARNIIAKSVEITGTLRAFNDEVFETLLRRIEEVSKGVAAGYGCEAEIEYIPMYRVVDNDRWMVDALVEAVGEENYVESPMQMISEDFSLFQRAVPGIYYYLGSRNEEKGYVYPLHSQHFQFDEEVLLTGVQVYKNLLEVLWKEPEKGDK